MDKKEQMNTRLYKKLCLEYENFINLVVTLPPNEILERAYEKVFKADILICFENQDISYEKAKALYSLKNPLEELYQEWLNTDVSYMEDLRDAIENRAGSAAKLAQKSVKDKDKER